VKTARPGLAARLVEISKLGHGGYVRLLFGVEGVRAAGRAYRTVAVLAHQDRVRASTYRASVTELRITQKQLAERRVRTEALEVEAARASAAAGQAVAARTALVDQIDARRDLNAQLVGELEAARQKLRTLPLPSSAAQPGGAEPALLPLRPFRGDLDWPVTGRVVSRFGRQTNPRFGTSTYQAGMAVAAPRDTPVHAIHEGVVAFAEPFVGFGNLVIVDHGNQAFSLYGHLSTVLVQRGTRVARGLTLGTVGTSPAGSAELYFELRIDGKPVDPVQWLRTR
jgi:septal ring factor EnvC (AmiA/AmiB activator)